MNGRMVAGLVLLVSAGICGVAGALETENVIFVMADGLRIQEVFGGADEALLNKEDGGVGNVDDVRVRFWRKTPGQRREALMPFLWNVVARDGQIFGNQAKGSVAQVSNGLNFSYPGFSETLCGVADPRVDSNNPVYNPNVNVLEWLNGLPRYKGHVAAFGAWDRFPHILNEKRSGLFINAGYDPIKGNVSEKMELLNTLKAEMTRYWGGEPFDSITFQTALEYFKAQKPRVFFVALGETDEWPHGKRYDLYLSSARLADEYVKQLWETAQSMPRYRGKTTLILSTDHGRGLAPEEWKGHGKDVKNSENIWMAFMGPDTPALGEREQADRVTASQIAATLAAFLGQDYRQGVPAAAAPIADVVKGK